MVGVGGRGVLVFGTLTARAGVGKGVRVAIAIRVGGRGVGVGGGPLRARAATAPAATSRTSVPIRSSGVTNRFFATGTTPLLRPGVVAWSDAGGPTDYLSYRMVRMVGKSRAICLTFASSTISQPERNRCTTAGMRECGQGERSEVRGGRGERFGGRAVFTTRAPRSLDCDSFQQEGRHAGARHWLRRVRRLALERGAGRARPRGRRGRLLHRLLCA